MFILTELFVVLGAIMFFYPKLARSRIIEAILEDKFNKSIITTPNVFRGFNYGWYQPGGI